MCYFTQTGSYDCTETYQPPPEGNDHEDGNVCSGKLSNITLPRIIPCVTYRGFSSASAVTLNANFGPSFH